MKKCFLFISIILLFGCKKTIDNNPNGNNNNNPNIKLKAFSIKLVDTTTTTATLSWTAAADSSSTNSITYSLYLDSNFVVGKIKAFTYKFSNLTPNKNYAVTIKAFDSTKDSITSTFSFTTKDNYLKFANQILPVNSLVLGFAISPDKGYVFTYQGILDTLFQGDGTPSTRAFHVLKTDSLGNVIWTKTFTFPRTDIGYLIKTISDGYLILGSNYMIKIDFEGNMIWNNIFDVTGFMFTNSFVVTQDKNIIIAGVESSNPLSLLMISLSSNGTVNWQKTYNTNQQTLDITDLTEIPDDNTLVVLGDYGYKFGLWKIDMSGNLIWQKSFGDTLTSSVPSHIIYSGNQLLVSGSSQGDYYLFQMKMYRLDLNGNVLKEILVSDPHFTATIPWFELTTDGGYVVLGQILETDLATYNAVYKYDSNDNEQWENLYGDFTSGKVIKQTADGGYIFPTNSSYTNATILVKTNQYGQY